MDDFISSLCSALSFNSLWGIIGSAVPFIALSTLFALGFYLIKKIIDTLTDPDKPFDEPLPGVSDEEYDDFYDELMERDIERDYDDYDDSDELFEFHDGEYIYKNGWHKIG